MELRPPPPLTPPLIRTVLKHLVDPEVGINVVDLGMLGDVQVSAAGAVVIELFPTSPGCPMLDTLADGARALVSNLAGVTSVEVAFLYDPPWTPERITEDGRAALARR